MTNAVKDDDFLFVDYFVNDTIIAFAELVES